MGLLCFSLYAFVVTRAQALWLLGAIGGVLVFADIVRFRSPRVNQLVLRVFGRVMRREELSSVSGNSFYVLGLVTLVLFFPKPIVLLSVLYLGLGDPAAAVVGTLYGQHKILGKKSWEGSIANFGVTAVATFLTGLRVFGFSFEHSFFLALLGGAISVTAELIPLPVDDNFSIPLISGILLSALPW